MTTDQGHSTEMRHITTYYLHFLDNACYLEVMKNIMKISADYISAFALFRYNYNKKIKIYKNNFVFLFQTEIKK